MSTAGQPTGSDTKINTKTAQGRLSIVIEVFSGRESSIYHSVVPCD
jgi:hypothetical protein